MKRKNEINPQEIHDQLPTDDLSLNGKKINTMHCTALRKGFFKPILKTARLDNTVFINKPNEQDLQLKNQAVELFITSLQSISEQTNNPALLSWILSTLAYYFMQKLDISPIYHRPRWIVANILNTQAINLYPNNEFAAEFKALTFDTPKGQKMLAGKHPDINYVHEAGNIDFNKVIEYFMVDLETVFLVKPGKIPAALVQLTNALRNIVDQQKNLQAISAILKNLADQLGNLECTENNKTLAF